MLELRPMDTWTDTGTGDVEAMHSFMKMLLLTSVIWCMYGCQSSASITNQADLSFSEQRVVPGSNSAAHLNTEQVLKIARDLVVQHHNVLEDYGAPSVSFYPQSEHWAICFPSKKLYGSRQSSSDSLISVLIDDNTGETSYNGENYALFKAIAERLQGSTNSAPVAESDNRQYRKAAFEVLIQEANRVARELDLPENLPIVGSDIVDSFVLPLKGAQAWKAIGTVSTRDYSYAVSMANKFCFLTKLHQEADRDMWHRDYVWSISRMDTLAAYQLATQWLSAVSMDVRRLNSDCKVHIRASTPDGQQAKRFVPLYSVYWMKGREGRGVAASVQMFLPTKTLLQLRVEDPVYILREPLRVSRSSGAANSVIENDKTEAP